MWWIEQKLKRHTNQPSLVDHEMSNNNENHEGSKILLEIGWLCSDQCHFQVMLDTFTMIP